MTLAITSLYAGLLGLWLLILSARVILYRRSASVSLGDAGDKVLMRRIRAQGNFTEYAAIALVLLALLELQGFPVWALHLLGAAFLIGRILHGLALSFSPKPSPLRVPGMVLTLLSLGALSLCALGLAVF